VKGGVQGPHGGQHRTVLGATADDLQRVGVHGDVQPLVSGRELDTVRLLGLRRQA
jgi:hypothetical protein